MSLIENPHCRWFYTFYHAWCERKALSRVLKDPHCRVNKLSDITGKKLDDANAAVLVLDFDGVLANHGEETPLPEAEAWLKKLSLEIGESRIAILTNQRFPKRIAYFAKHFPLIHVVQDGRKKPYPDGILEIANYKGVPVHRVVLVDDRLLTGMLATCLACCQGWYFTHPYRNACKNPIKELFFSTLRVVERWVFRLG